MSETGVEIALGMKVKDSVTGFVGYVTGRTFYLNGCDRCAVESKKRTADGKTITEWIDTIQLFPVANAPKLKLNTPTGKVKKDEHGPRLAPPSLVRDPD